jgi:hypothetical protein
MPFDVKHISKDWGGARNRADRVSHTLPLAKALAIIIAAYRAHSLGLSFNRHVTIHWTAAGIVDDQAAAATGRIIKLATDWMRTKGNKAAWTWVRENDMERRLQRVTRPHSHSFPRYPPHRAHVAAVVAQGYWHALLQRQHRHV